MAELLAEKWMKGVAITTTVLAVCASIAGSRSTNSMTKAQLLTGQEASDWAYYQAKSIKQSLMESQQKAFAVQSVGVENPYQRTRLEQELKTLASEIKRYDEEKEVIRAKAVNVGKDNAVVARQTSQYSLAVVFLQIGIMLSSVSALLKRKEVWVLGLVFGVIGLVFLANGFLLFIDLPGLF